MTFLRPSAKVSHWAFCKYITDGNAHLFTRMLAAIVRSCAYPLTPKPALPGRLPVPTRLLLALSPSTGDLSLVDTAVTFDRLPGCAFGTVTVMTELVTGMRLTCQEPFARFLASRHRNVFPFGEGTFDNQILLVRRTRNDEWYLTRRTWTRLRCSESGYQFLISNNAYA